MHRIAIAVLLAAVVAPAALIPATGAASAAPTAAQAQGDTLVNLARAVDGFGYANMKGPDRVINSYALPGLLRRAPAGHLINLLFAGAQNPPSGYRYHIDFYNTARATVTVTWLWGPANGLKDRLTWVNKAGGWKIAGIQVLGRQVDRREALAAANAVFVQRLKTAPSFALNDLASRALLDRAPNHMVASYFPMQNPPRIVTYTIQRYAAGSATVALTLDWGNATKMYRTLSWVYTASGWQIASVSQGGAGRG